MGHSAANVVGMTVATAPGDRIKVRVSEIDGSDGVDLVREDG